MGIDQMNGIRAGARIAVGSLPQADAQSAVRVQCQAFPEVPAWPQMPKRTIRERITLQGLSGLPGLHFKQDGTATWKPPPGGWNILSMKLVEARKSGELNSAALTPDDAAGFFAFLKEGPSFFKPELQAVKGQCVGPVTLGMALRSPEGKPCLRDQEAMEALVEYLTNHALWQARTLSTLGKPVVMFLDEPSRGGWDPVEMGLDPRTVRGWYDRILGPLQEEGVLTGLHACGKGPFAWALRSCVEIFHFDGHRFLDPLLGESGDLAAFLGQGGWLSFGMVPTAMSHGVFPEAAGLVDRWMRFAHELSRRGVPSGTLAAQSAFSTSCGLGGGSLAVAEEASRCLAGFTALWNINSKIGFPE